MKTYYPHRKTLTIWRTLLTFAAVVPAVIIAFALKGRLYYLVFGIWFLLYLLLFLVYMPLLYKSLVYSVGEDMVLVKRGVFYHTERRMSPSNMQFTALSADPFSKIFRLVNLRIVCAGSRLFLLGLVSADATEILNIIERSSETFAGGEDVFVV